MLNGEPTDSIRHFTFPTAPNKHHPKNISREIYGGIVNFPVSLGRHSIGDARYTFMREPHGRSI